MTDTELSTLEQMSRELPSEHLRAEDYSRVGNFFSQRYGEVIVTLLNAIPELLRNARELAETQQILDDLQDRED